MAAPDRTNSELPHGTENSRSSVCFTTPITPKKGDIETEFDSASPEDASTDLKKKRASQAFDGQFLLQRAMSTKKASSSNMIASIANKVNQGAATTSSGSTKTTTDVPVGDRLLSEYDHGEPEHAFPHLAKGVNTEQLQAYYNTVRAVIFEAIHDNNFRGGVFKSQVTPTRQVRLMLNTIMFSKDISQEQHEIIKQYMRTWSKAIGDSGSNGDGFILDQTFIETTNLDVALDQLRNMFEKEKNNPLPIPMPYRQRYKDAATLRREAELREEIKQLRASENSKGKATASTPLTDTAVPDKSVLTAGSSTTSEKSPSASAATSASGSGRAPRSKKNIFEVSSFKDDILAGLATSTNLSKEGAQKAMEDISKVKGSKLTSKDIDKLSDETIDALHQHMCKDAQTAGKKMPLGAALEETIRRLEGMSRDA